MPFKVFLEPVRMATHLNRVVCALSGNVQRTVTQTVKVQYHQHTQRAISECEGPIITGNNQILF